MAEPGGTNSWSIWNPGMAELEAPTGREAGWEPASTKFWGLRSANQVLPVWSSGLGREPDASMVTNEHSVWDKIVRGEPLVHMLCCWLPVRKTGLLRLVTSRWVRKRRKRNWSSRRSGTSVGALESRTRSTRGVSLALPPLSLLCEWKMAWKTTTSWHSLFSVWRQTQRVLVSQVFFFAVIFFVLSVQS